MKTIFISAKLEAVEGGRFRVFRGAQIIIDGVPQERVLKCLVQLEKDEPPVVTLKFQPEELIFEGEVEDVKS